MNLKNRTRLRFAGRWLVLVAAVVLAWPTRSETQTSLYLPALSPYLTFAGALAARAVSMATLLAVPAFMLALLYPRWFCRHACPTGFTQELLQRLHPSDLSRRSFSGGGWRRWPPIGKWLVVVTVGGAVLGYPIFLWLDPLAIFNGFLNAWHKPVALVAGLGFPVILIFDFLLPKVWCQRLCPLGATQELLALPARRLRRRSDLPAAHKHRLARRAFLGVCAGGAGAALIRTVRGESAPPLRPPGALDEERFAGVCVRCGNCVSACPSHIIQPDFGAHGVTGLLAPVLNYSTDYCHADCYRCTIVCPSGAIERLALADKRRRIIGTAPIDLDTCLLAQGQECTACITHCPYTALSIQRDDDGFSARPHLNLARCNGCGACEAVCPVRPVRSIRVVARRGVLPVSEKNSTNQPLGDGS